MCGNVVPQPQNSGSKFNNICCINIPTHCLPAGSACSSKFKFRPVTIFGSISSHATSTQSITFKVELIGMNKHCWVVRSLFVLHLCTLNKIFDKIQIWFQFFLNIKIKNSLSTDSEYFPNYFQAG